MFRGRDLHILTQIGRLWPRSFRFGDPLPAIHRSWFGAAIRREMTILRKLPAGNFCDLAPISLENCQLAILEVVNWPTPSNRRH